MSCTTIPDARARSRQAAEAIKLGEKVAKLELDLAVASAHAELFEQQCGEHKARADSAEAAKAALSEQLSVAQAERKLLDETLTACQVMVAELRAERDALRAECSKLSQRAGEADSLNRSLQAQQGTTDEIRTALQEQLAVVRAEGTLLQSQLEELKARAAASQEAADAGADKLLAERHERAAWQEKAAVAEAERKLLDEAAAAARVAQQALQTQLATSEARGAEGHSLCSSAMEQCTRMERELEVAAAEKELLHQVGCHLTDGILHITSYPFYPPYSSNMLQQVGFQPTPMLSRAHACTAGPAFAANSDTHAPLMRLERLRPTLFASPHTDGPSAGAGQGGRACNRTSRARRCGERFARATRRDRGDSAQRAGEEPNARGGTSRSERAGGTYRWQAGAA